MGKAALAVARLVELNSPKVMERTLNVAAGCGAEIND